MSIPLIQKFFFLLFVAILAFAMGLLVAKNAQAQDGGLTSEPPNSDLPVPSSAGEPSSAAATTTRTTTTTTTTETISTSKTGAAKGKGPKGAPKIIYPKNSKVDFEGLTLQGEVRNPGEFYFQRRPEEKFDSLVKRRKNFHKEMLRDVVISK